MNHGERPQAFRLPTETVYAHPELAPAIGDSWWARYVSTLGSFTETSRSVLEIDCRYIVDSGIFGAGEPSDTSWPPSRARTGLVMGSVQSGKTASMLGAIALSLDRGVDIVVVLAGTRLSLWQQTLDRLQAQLDQGEDSAEKQRRRILLPKTPPNEPIPIATRYQLTRVRVERALSRHQPIIVVALKHSGHLQALGQSLSESVFPEVGRLRRPIHMLVIDDEADDGSILDANVEASQDPLFGNLKQIPRAIADLWSPPSRLSPANLFATYVGYTATPQANLLQEEHNPLSPRDFLVTLRTPLDRGDLTLRTSTYVEPKGIDQYYTGGEVYYRRGRAAGLCVPTTASPSDDLADSLRSFLVAGAIRLFRDGKRLGHSTARKTTFRSVTEANELAPKPHSMLIHPSASVSDHFTTAEDVLIWSGVTDRSEARSLLSAGTSYLSTSLQAMVDVDEEKWAEWLEHFQKSSNEIHAEFNTLTPPPMPDWATAKRLLKEEVIPGTRVAVVNSDPAADDRPDYEPRAAGDDSWLAPRDISTIFVSGNVMARGLTLEGLTTTLFHRTSESPRADTQMQMQRWFGYRGSQIDLCRVFTTEEQINFFTSYHDVDESLRGVIASAMRYPRAAPGPQILQGRGFLATGKIANLGNKPLHPGRKPFVPLINTGLNEDPNVNLVVDLFRAGRSSDVKAGGRVRGRILEEPLTLDQAALLLDRLSYSTYRPGRDNQQGELWSQVETSVAAVQALPNDYRLYRPPTPNPGTPPSPVRKDCPYGIPAYLRLWDASLSRHVRGLFDTGARDQTWSMVNLGTKQTQQPRFWVGIRYGASNSPPAQGAFRDLPFAVRTTQREVENGLVKNSWGSNNPEADPTDYRGDEYFDYYHRDEALPIAPRGGEAWRPPGSDGQILFYVNKHPNQLHPTISLGVCIPSGGPDQFAAYLQKPRALANAEVIAHGHV